MDSRLDGFVRTLQIVEAHAFNMLLNGVAITRPSQSESTRQVCPEYHVQVRATRDRRPTSTSLSVTIISPY